MRGRKRRPTGEREPILVDGIARLMLPELVRVEQNVVRQAMLLTGDPQPHAAVLAVAAIYLERATAAYLAACDATLLPPDGAAAVGPEEIH